MPAFKFSMMSASFGEVSASSQPDPPPDMDKIFPHTAHGDAVFVSCDSNAPFGSPASGDNGSLKGVDSSKKCWKSVLTGTRNNSLETIYPEIFQTKEGTKLFLPETIMDEVSSSLHLALVGRFLAFRLTINMVRRWANARWKLKGSVTISAMPGGLFLFKFMVEEDLIYVLSGTWAYGKHFLTLAKWKSGFDPSAELTRMALVWVRLPGLPL